LQLDENSLASLHVSSLSVKHQNNISNKKKGKRKRKKKEKKNLVSSLAAEFTSTNKSICSLFFASIPSGLNRSLSQVSASPTSCGAKLAPTNEAFLLELRCLSSRALSHETTFFGASVLEKRRRKKTKKKRKKKEKQKNRLGT
jgi:hypothetical protein